MIGHLTDEYLREMGHTDDGDIYGIVSEILALRAQNAELVGALNWIAHTFTEDSHGNMKTLPASEYQAHARATLAAAGQMQGSRE